jgi:predicted Rossmann fold flavoprotein
MMNKDVKYLQRNEEKWTIRFSNDEKLDAEFVCIACGGYPKTSMFEWITATGHSIEPPVPSLFTFNMPGNTITELMGVSVSDAQVRVTGTKLSERGPLLITHWGMSGPVILRLSAWGARELQKLNYEFRAVVNWVSEYNENSLREHWWQLRSELAGQLLSIRNPFRLPQRLWLYLLQQSGIHETTRWSDLPAALQSKLIKNMCANEFLVKGKTTFKEEFVTAGGVKLQEVDANTMESRICPNLYFAGEILDVDGITGGFNFQHAWTSGWIAAKSIAKKAVSMLVSIES